MAFLDLIKARYSVRSYASTPVEEAKLNAVLEAARLAPTAANLQPFRLIVAQVKDQEAEMQRVYRRHCFAQAPLAICACAIPAQGWVRAADGFNCTIMDVAIVMDHLILAATELGLGTCWVAAFDVAAARRVFGLPDGVEPIALTPLGYPSDHAGIKERKPLSELVRYGHW